MNVLIWLSSFPEISETFIRDQIIGLLKEGLNVNILCRTKKDYKNGLEGYSEFNLLNRTKNFEELYPKNKIIRIFKFLYILTVNVFSKNFIFLLRSLDYTKFGKRAKSLECFFITNYIINNCINVVHCHYGPNGKDAVFLKEIGLNVKLICTFHGYDIRLGIQNGVEFYSNLFQHIDSVIAISIYNKEKLISFGLEIDKIIYLNNGVKIVECKKTEDNFEGNVKIISVGRLVKEKAYHLALNAFKLILERFPDLEYHIIGDGILKNELIILVNDLGIKDKVTFHLARESPYVINMMLKSDIFLLSSVNEALPTVILEAYSCCLPVIATDVGSVKQIVQDNVTGYLASPEINSIYKALNQMLSNRSDWEIFARAGKIMVEEEYNIDIQSKKLVNIYNE